MGIPFVNWLYWQRTREHFKYGCANTAVIVSLNPMLIAVSTDLTKGLGEYPAIKIIKKNLAIVNGQIPRIGTKLSTVSLYMVGDEDLPHWTDFDPRPVDCATDNLQSVSSVMNQFSEDDWLELNSWIKKVPRPFQCGLYLIEENRHES